MAGEWLKFECSTPDKPEVFAITVEMGWDDPDLTVGKLFRIWRWFDQHTVDGNAQSVTFALLDRYCGVTGFAQAMCNVGWLIKTDGGFQLPNFDRHNGKTAKERALGAKRAAIFKSNAKSNGHSVTNTVTASLPREEKKREEKNIKTIGPAAPSLNLFADVDDQVVADFKAMRAKQKAPITKTAIDGIAREAAKAGLSLEGALRVCCERNWRGFNADWVLPDGKPVKAGAWWASEATILAKGEELGMRPNPGEAMVQFKGRIDAAIAAAGKPKVVQATRISTVPEKHDTRTFKPAGVDLLSLVKGRASA